MTLNKECIRSIVNELKKNEPFLKYKDKSVFQYQDQYILVFNAFPKKDLLNDNLYVGYITDIRKFDLNNGLKDILLLSEDDIFVLHNENGPSVFRNSGSDSFNLHGVQSSKLMIDKIELKRKIKNL